MSKKILVTGAAGNVGSEVVRQLAAAGHRVRAFVRSTEAAGKLPKHNNVEIVRGDYDQPATLETAAKGVDAVFALVPVNPDQVRWMTDIIDAAKRAGVKHVVKHSGLGSGPNALAALIRDHDKTDQYLRQSGLGYTILQPNSFMQNLLWSAESIKGQGAFYLPLAEARQSVIDIADIAAVAVKALTEPEHHKNKTYVLTGPQSLSFAEQAQIIGTAIGKPVQYVAVPSQAAAESMRTMGMSDWMVNILVDFYAAVATGAYADVTGDVKKVLGREPGAFGDFVQRHLAAFK
jgi:uncharacterized protein YbjT (DUF2867 family)